MEHQEHMIQIIQCKFDSHMARQKEQFNDLAKQFTEERLRSQREFGIFSHSVKKLIEELESLPLQFSALEQ